jgi:sugar O-acyltransferase (sialic acid O-acetyltransferase NeuD family)
MSNSAAFIYGAQGHAKVVAEILRLNNYRIRGFIDGLSPSRVGEDFCGSTVLGGDKVLEDLIRSEVKNVVVAFGDNRLRLQVAHRLGRMGFHLLTALHPSAICASDARIGPGTVVAAGAVVGPSSLVGSNAILNTQSSVDHDCIVGDGAHVGPGAVISGVVEVGECAWIGAGAVVSDHKRIGADAVAGAGAVVVRDVPEAVVVIGVPARIARPVKR